MAASMSTRIWPDIYKRIQGEWKDGYVVTCIRMNEHTRKRISDELSSPFQPPYMKALGADKSILTITTEFGTMLVKIDKAIPDDKVALQAEAPGRRYNGPVEVEVTRAE